MYNDPELDGNYLGTITKDFVIVADTLREAAYLIKKENISDFPIFVSCKQPIAIGKLLICQGEIATSWNYYASFLNEFVDRKLIEEVDLFKAAYKNPDEFCCLFVVDVEFTNFVFIPYPED